jgi:hypothetical protein
VESRRVGAAVGGGDPDQDVVGTGLGVFHLDVEVPVLVKDTGIGQFELAIVLPATPILRHQPAVRELPLRVLIEGLLVGMRGSGIQVVVAFLDVLAVVALVVREAEEAFLQDGVFAIP